MDYIIISPVKDERDYIQKTLDSVVRQSIHPKVWLIVDDGSSDGSPEIVEEYCRKFSWIRLLRLNRLGTRQFPAEIQAFNAGYQLVKDEKYDFIVKLDCDLAFENKYFERLLYYFKEDHRLGIASGVYLERKRDVWFPVKMPEYHTAGASKMVRANCFKEIGGFLPKRGWDTIDEIRAQMRGWRTKHFPELEIQHLKKEGSGIGQLAVNAMHGEIYYLMGGGKLFFLLKTIHRGVAGQPFMIGSIMMVYGYLKAYLLKKELVVSREEALYYQKMLNMRILKGIRSLCAKERGM